jgi:hypothetical protein
MDMVKTGTGAVLMVLASGAVGVNSPEKFIFEGTTAVTVLESDTECESGSLSVFGSDSVRQGLPGSTVEVFGANQDTCTGELVRTFDGRADLADMQFVVSASGDSAVLMATVTVFDFVRNMELPIAINLRWTAVPGQPSFRHGIDRFQSSNFSNTLKFAFKG